MPIWLGWRCAFESRDAGALVISFAAGFRKAALVMITGEMMTEQLLATWSERLWDRYSRIGRSRYNETATRFERARIRRGGKFGMRS